MANQVWKCDFCSKTDIRKSIIEIHETQCSFNEHNRKCLTCENREDSSYEVWYSCKVLSHDEVEEWQESGGPCKYWVKEKQS